MAKPKAKAQPYNSSKINYIDTLIKDKKATNILEEIQSKLRKQKTVTFHLVPQQQKIEDMAEEKTHNSSDTHSPDTPEEARPTTKSVSPWSDTRYQNGNSTHESAPGYPATYLDTDTNRVQHAQVLPPHPKCHSHCPMAITNMPTMLGSEA
ncbi:hypothetical protein C2G38_2222298 [Gigaspora rosea]|uniref:Uncharacterized protein n=1 Tax=Gigaspora rosea TaxID=44941 RepID=A0A397UBD9_9GLOM|nr:hypothetical protein C2G38_2222298 [Gigaspora rosea]